MSVLLEPAIPPPHLLQSRPASWPRHYNTHHYPASPSSPAPMSPQSLQSYMSRLTQSPLPSQEITNLPTSSWYGPSISAPDCHSETTYTSYYMPPQTSAINLSPPSSTFAYPAKAPGPTTQVDPSAAISPASVYSRESVVPESARPSEEPQSDARSALHQSTSRLRPQSHLMDRPQSSSASLHPAPLDVPWTMNSSLGIHSAHDSYYPAFPALARSPRMSEPLIELPPNSMASPQPRRIYTPIAPLPLEAPRSHGSKRFREEEEESVDEPKRRKRSDSNVSTQFELSEEDRLLLQLKEEESMPWKDIAARFQSDLNKAYQIPALQMRLKRLRERMRVWTEQDIRALRMAHEYWAQNKFDIIAQKMLEFGAQEKWTARQCSRKWQEIDPAPMPYAHFEHHVQQGFAPYAMSPVEPPSYLPFLHA